MRVISHNQTEEIRNDLQTEGDIKAWTPTDFLPFSAMTSSDPTI